MPSLTLTDNIQVLTRDRGWQFVSAITLKDSIQCAHVNIIDSTTETRTSWSALYRMNTASCCYMQYLASKGFLLTYDDADVVLHTGSRLSDNDMEETGDVAKVQVTSQLNNEIHRYRHVVSVLDEHLQPIALNTPENQPYLHTKEHKLWRTVYKFYWESPTRIESYKSKDGLRDLQREVPLGNDWVTMPLLRQGGPLFDTDSFSVTESVAVYALASKSGCA